MKPSGFPSGRDLVLAAAALGLLGLILTTSLPQRPHYLALLNDAGHAPVFLGLAWVLLALLDRRVAEWPAAWRYLGAFCAAVAAGALVEVVQAFMERESSLGDLLMDAAGAGGVLSGVALWRGRTPPARRSALGSAGLIAGIAVAGAIVAAPLVHGAAAYSRRADWFPVIASFEAASDLYFVAPINAELERIALPPAYAEVPDEPALKVAFIDTSYPGVQLWEPEPDWRGYRVLRVDVVNPGDAPLRLGLRIEDAAHNQDYEDRFNFSADMPAASRQVLSIAVDDIASGPRHRPLDLGAVARLAVFEGSGAATVGRAFYLSRVWLE